MNKHAGFIFALCTLLSVALKGQLQVITDRTDATYQSGESMNFIVSGDNDTVNYTIHYDQGATPAIERGMVIMNNDSANIPFQINEPSVVMCIVSSNGFIDIAGAAFSPAEIQPYEDDPADYDTFWENQKAELASVSIDPILTPLLSNTDTRTKDFRINLGHVDGRRVYGYLSIPNRPGTFPAVISHAAFGAGPNICIPRPEIAADIGVISLSIWMHDGEPDTMVDGAYFPRNWDNPAKNYFRYGVLGIIRAIDYIYTMPEFQGQGIGLNGISEGGGMSILAAGIDERVTAVAASIHAHSEHSGFKYGRASGFPFYGYESAILNQGIYPENINQAVKYFDAVRGAKRFKGAFLGAVGYTDQTSIPATNFSTYNQLNGSTIIIHKVKSGHLNPDEFYLGKFDFFRRVFDLQGEKGYAADAGFDQILTAQDAFLSGIIQKSGTDNFNLPIKWKKISGPGDVVFSNPNERNTSASFSENGEYLLRFTATDKSMLDSDKTFFTISDHVKITIGRNDAPDDADNDGFDNTVDCDDSDPSIGVPGSACDDGNSETENDLIQNDCICLGTIPPPPDDCNVEYSLNGLNLTVEPMNDLINFVKVYDLGFNLLMSCQEWSIACDETQEFTLPNDGEYLLQILTYSDWSTEVCNIFEKIVALDTSQSCQNVTNGGTITGEEMICPGDTPMPILSSSLPSGDNSTIEYLWLGSEQSCPGALSDSIPGAHEATYELDMLSKTTYFRRLSRRVGCQDWFSGISNCIVKRIKTDCDTIPQACDAEYSLTGNQMTISNLDQPITAVKIIDQFSWTAVYDCNDFINPCPNNIAMTLPLGKYFIQILTGNSWNEDFLCNIFDPFEVPATQNRISEPANAFTQERLTEEFASRKKNQPKVIVFPNPAKDFIQIAINDLNGQVVKIELINQLGKIEQTSAVSGQSDLNTTTFSVKNLTPGIYFIKIKTRGSQSIMKKLFVK